MPPFMTEPITALQRFHRWCFYRQNKHRTMKMSMSEFDALNKLIPRIERTALDHVISLIEDQELSNCYSSRTEYRAALAKKVGEFRDRRD